MKIEKWRAFTCFLFWLLLLKNEIEAHVYLFLMINLLHLWPCTLHSRGHVEITYCRVLMLHIKDTQHGAVNILTISCYPKNYEMK